MEKQFEQFEVKTKTFTGFISKDPEMKYLDSGSCVIKFSLPLKKNKDDEAVWLNCESWGKKAEEIAEKYKKGDSIAVTGYFKTTEYNNKKYLAFNVI